MGLLKVKQRQLIALRQVSEKPQITHQVTDGLADLGAGTEILSGEEGAVLGRVHHTLCRIQSQSGNAA